MWPYFAAAWLGLMIGFVLGWAIAYRLGEQKGETTLAESAERIARQDRSANVGIRTP